MLNEDELQEFMKAQLRGGPLPRTPNDEEVQQILQALIALKRSGGPECPHEIAREPDAQVTAVLNLTGVLKFFLGAMLVLPPTYR